MNDFEKMLRDMFSSIWDCEIDHPLWQDTVGEIMTAVIQAHEKCMPEPCEDAVSRQAALIALRKCQTYLYDARDQELKIELSSAEAAINNLSTIQPEKAQLSKQCTTSDLISRQAALDAVEKNACNTQRIMDAVNNLPPAKPEPHWIPVERELPEDLEEVNVTWINRNPEPYYESIKDKPFTATAVYYKGKWYWWSTCAQDLLAEYGERCSVGLLHEAIEVTAWMPLPTPYTK